jgi:uncharacterized SAM-binding protein YcdF (DUF218 family)
MKNKRAWLAAAGLMALALAIFHSALLGACGDFLVKAEPPRNADLAVVLAGDFSGSRVTTAAELVREGYAPKALLSGPYGVYGYYESELALGFAEKQGFPASYFESFHHHALSTREEAAAIIPELRRRGAKTILLVTSDYHTRRAAKLFRAAAPDLTFIAVAAPDEYFSPHGWWRDRQGRKTFAIESMKTVAEWLGM